MLPHDKSLSSPSTLPSNLATPSSGSLKAGPLPLLFNTLSPSRVRTNVRHSAGATDTDLSSEGGSSSESEEVGELSLSRGMKRLTVCGLVPAQERPYVADSQVRFHGKSSWFKLIEPIRKLREEHAYSVTSGPDSSMFSQDNINPAATRRPEFWTTPDVSSNHLFASHAQVCCEPGLCSGNSRMKAPIIIVRVYVGSLRNIFHHLTLRMN